MAGQCLWENLFWVRDPWYAVVGKVLHQKATKGSVSYSHSINENNDMLIFQCVDGWVSQYNQIGVSGYLLTTASYNGPIQLRQWWIQLAYITKHLLISRTGFLRTFSNCLSWVLAVWSQSLGQAVGTNRSIKPPAHLWILPGESGQGQGWVCLVWDGEWPRTVWTRWAARRSMARRRWWILLRQWWPRGNS